MLLVLNTLFPIFGLILAGYVCRRSARLGETAASELNRCVVWLCLPALLFRITATATLEQVWQPSFILVVGLATLLVFVAVLGIRLLRGASLADASIESLAAAYANTGYVGIPLCLFVLGEEGLAPALVATLLVVCGLFSLAIIGVEIGRQQAQGLGRVLRKVARALAGNPLVVTPVVGALWNLADLPLPAAPMGLLKLLGDATTPCALVSLGAFLARRETVPVGGQAPVLVALKLLLHPALAWVLAYHVFPLPPLWAQAAVLLCALPTGTGPYMLAELYGRGGAGVSRAILWSTLGSVPTLSLGLMWLS